MKKVTEVFIVYQADEYGLGPPVAVFSKMDDAMECCEILSNKPGDRGFICDAYDIDWWRDNIRDREKNAQDKK